MNSLFSCRVLMLKFIYLCCFFCFYFLLCMLLYFLFSRSLSSLIFSLITNCSKIVLIFPISPYFLLYSSLISFYFIFIGIILFCLHLYYFISSSFVSFYFILPKGEPLRVLAARHGMRIQSSQNFHDLIHDFIRSNNEK